jgi:TonB family protein
MLRTIKAVRRNEVMRRIFAATVLSVGVVVGLVDPSVCVGQGQNDSSANPKATLSSHKSVGFPQKDVDFGEYMADLQRRIKAQWTPPKGHEADRVVFTFNIHKSGDVSDIKLVSGSGFAQSDEAALAALKHASPLKPLPEGASDTVGIQFTFDKNVFYG